MTFDPSFLSFAQIPFYRVSHSYTLKIFLLSIILKKLSYCCIFLLSFSSSLAKNKEDRGIESILREDSFFVVVVLFCLFVF